MTRHEAMRKAVDGWFRFGCDQIGDRSGSIGTDIARLHAELVEVCDALGIEAPEIPSYYRDGSLDDDLFLVDWRD